MEVEALNGEPGVRSARYAGDGKNFQANIDLLLNNLENRTNRKARFRTVISLLMDGKEFFFEGICEGEIIQQQSGNKGFGYDPIFQPEGFSTTFAEMTIEQKSIISHRGIAVQKLIKFLSNLSI